MSTLYVENVPTELYQALRKRARENRKSIAAEVISLLQRNIPTAKELQSRREFYDRISKLRARDEDAAATFPSAEQMIREDRDR